MISGKQFAGLNVAAVRQTVKTAITISSLKNFLHGQAVTFVTAPAPKNAVRTLGPSSGLFPAAINIADSLYFYDITGAIFNDPAIPGSPLTIKTGDDIKTLFTAIYNAWLNPIYPPLPSAPQIKANLIISGNAISLIATDGLVTYWLQIFVNGLDGSMIFIDHSYLNPIPVAKYDISFGVIGIVRDAKGTPYRGGQTVIISYNNGSSGPDKVSTSVQVTTDTNGRFSAPKFHYVGNQSLSVCASVPETNEQNTRVSGGQCTNALNNNDIYFDFRTSLPNARPF